MEPVDIAFLLNNNRVRFTRSSRKHRVGRARIRTVLATNPVVDITAEGDLRARLLAVGPDWTGRQLEVVAVIEEGYVVVIHAMDARPKLIRLYTERRDDGTMQEER